MFWESPCKQWIGLKLGDAEAVEGVGEVERSLIFLIAVRFRVVLLLFRFGAVHFQLLPVLRP